jgi:hypothetical protein
MDGERNKQAKEGRNEEGINNKRKKEIRHLALLNSWITFITNNHITTCNFDGDICMIHMFE